MSSDPIEVLRRMRNEWPLATDEGPALDAAIASLSAPKPESAEAVIPWVREWKGSGPQRGFHIREATRLHNNRVVAYLGDQVDGAEVDKLIAEHNGKHPNGDPVRPAPPRPEESAPVGVEEVWLFNGSNGVWHTFHSEKHRLDTIADGGWDVRKFIAQQPAPVAPVGVEAVLAKLREGLGADGTLYQQAEGMIRALAQQPAAVDEVQELARWVLEAVTHDEECDAMTTFDDDPEERCTCGCSDAFAKCERILAGQQHGGES